MAQHVTMAGLLIGATEAFGGDKFFPKIGAHGEFKNEKDGSATLFFLFFCYKCKPGLVLTITGIKKGLEESTLLQCFCYP